ncbi:hypothetical protein D9M70_264010 [compost metagenome]
MGRRIVFLLLALTAFPALATERVHVDPFIKAGPGYTATTGSITGYIPSRTTSDLLLEAERKGWLGPTSAKTPVALKAKVTVPISGIGGVVKGIARGSAGAIALNGAIAVAIAGVGWVMSDDNTRAQIKSPALPDGTPVVMGKNFNPALYCQLFPASQTIGKITVTTWSGTTYAVGAWPGGDGTVFTGPDDYSEARNNCTDSSLGYKSSPQGYSPMSGAKVISIQEIVSLKRDLYPSELDALDPWVSAQTAPFLRDLLQESCEGSLNPQACLDDLQKQSRPSISGPATVQGPTQSSAGTYNRPDGTQGTTGSTTSTTYNIRYGDTYLDYDTVTTTTNFKDGTQTSQESSSDQGEPQEKPPEEDEDKPKRLASGEPCDVPLSCSGDAIDCAVLAQDKALRCAYDAQNDFGKHKSEVKAAVQGDQFKLEDDKLIEVPNFINTGTRFLPATCPADKTFSLSTGGGRTFALTYAPLCSFAIDLGYLIVVAVSVFCATYTGRAFGGE